ncbi:MAG TPA: hypothetical protein VG755_04275 [Nannocystaceae bacterium]|nr:hypothetical protein [Nannocystaceae bacterium]
MKRNQVVVWAALASACGADVDANPSFGNGSVGSTSPRGEESGSVDVGESSEDAESDGGSGGAVEGGKGDESTKWDLGSADDGGESGPIECPPPALLIVVDRSFSMAEDSTGNDAPNVHSTKWAYAVAAIEGFVAMYDASIELGFAMFPSPADNQYCDHVDEVLGDAHVDGFLCSATVEIAPAPGTAAAIADRIDPVDTRLCKGTPIDAALQAAGAALAGSGAVGNIVLVTDGKEKCNGNPVARAQALLASGVATWVIGFGNLPPGSVSHQSLNQLACAGGTATDFDTSCVVDGLGNAVAVDPAGAALYLPAEDGQALSDALQQQIAGTICCGSACPPG